MERGVKKRKRDRKQEINVNGQCKLAEQFGGVLVAPSVCIGAQKSKKHTATIWFALIIPSNVFHFNRSNELVLMVVVLILFAQILL